MVTSLISSACSLTMRIAIGSLCAIDSCPKETRFQSEVTIPLPRQGTGLPQAWKDGNLLLGVGLSAYHRFV
jgi:hypothetical protein